MKKYVEENYIIISWFWHNIESPYKKWNKSSNQFPPRCMFWMIMRQFYINLSIDEFELKFAPNFNHSNDVLLSKRFYTMQKPILPEK